MSVVKYFAFKPFVGESGVTYGLVFDRWSKEVADALKALNRTQWVRDKVPDGKPPFGWLRDFHCWFARAEAWEDARNAINQRGHSLLLIDKPDHIAKAEQQLAEAAAQRRPFAQALADASPAFVKDTPELREAMQAL